MIDDILPILSQINKAEVFAYFVVFAAIYTFIAIIISAFRRP